MGVSEVRVRVWSSVVLVAAAGVGLVRWFGTGPGETPPERLAASVALAALVAAPALWAGIGGARRPARLIVAGIVLVPLAIVSPVTMILVVPAVALVVLGARYRHRPGTVPSDPVRVAVALVIAVTGLTLALVALEGRDDPRSWAVIDGRTVIADGEAGPLPAAGVTRAGSLSDAVTLGESALTLLLVLLTVVAVDRLLPPPAPVSRASRGADRDGGPAIPRR